ncbi:Endo/excinuclease amino terminal domain protein [Vibrio coralliirubri]|uniref:GIY-YIG nuclease family protein n=1 Tax=Vibrio coralliirubri TaxID=1516159 RepID=UPI000639FCC5|nr:GIY-YIG nuclease family protein [Vibrio coralliirubri]CDT89202.1 Endo/excinuclease amino terminal domain protein [Vibrio coralliirubri]
MKQPAIYILTNDSNSVLYISVTGNLTQRVWLHRTGGVKGFTQKYNVHKLIYFEVFENFKTAIEREKQLKKWKRSWKDELISRVNPSWNDLYDEIS